ncbi:STAS domain-containing protein [Agitococcus lubricus]|uniref:Anti-sigma factor antagonist n=1 Tax=Agitococcus lubricus TaxID=1077255 RepID=A0A2T5IZ45_9GAMM|nr:STAS domain-containing protein [Agitococcus lubricus]PTQ89226.1 anti-sigma B factor antagonist [Agitococcus lubricus]
MSMNEQQGVMVIKPQNKRIDAAFAIELKAQMMSLIQQGHQRIVLDFANIEFMDSSGLGTIVAMMKMLGGSQYLALCHVNDTVLNVLRLTRTDKILAVEANPASAIARLTSMH